MRERFHIAGVQASLRIFGYEEVGVKASEGALGCSGPSVVISKAVDQLAGVRKSVGSTTIDAKLHTRSAG
jgi:hypothetical protein